jgi:hypothetical protein
MTFKLRSSGLPFKEIGSSPAKHTKEVAGFEHPHPHTEKEEKAAKTVKKIAKHDKTPTVVPKEMEEMGKAKSEVEQSLRTPAKMHKPGHVPGWQKWEKGKEKVKNIAKKVVDPLGLSNKFNIGGYLKGEQGYIPDYKGESTKKTVNKVARKVVKATTDKPKKMMKKSISKGASEAASEAVTQGGKMGLKQSMKRMKRPGKGVEKKYTKVTKDIKMKPPYKKPVGPRAN